jgi:hypothetical protein
MGGDAQPHLPAGNRWHGRPAHVSGQAVIQKLRCAPHLQHAFRLSCCHANGYFAPRVATLPKISSPRFARILPGLAWAAMVVAGFIAESGARPDSTDPLVFVEGPLWDISDEGLPYRLTVAWPVTPDPLARLLRAGESRWTVSAGYAVAYDNFDTGTNTVGARGRDGLMFNAGRQTLWPLPLRLPRGALRLELEVGLHYAARSLPADGTHLSFSLVGGFEWSSAPGDRR